MLNILKIILINPFRCGTHPRNFTLTTLHPFLEFPMSMIVEIVGFIRVQLVHVGDVHLSIFNKVS